MQAGIVPMVEKASSLNELLARLVQIKDQRATMADISFFWQKSAIYQAIAETQLPHVGQDRAEERDAYICGLRSGAMTMRQACDKILRDGEADSDILTRVRDNIRELDEDCGAYLTNLVLLLNPAAEAI